jgi:hypothetical protein
MVGIFLRSAGVTAAMIGEVLDGRKDFDLDDVVHVRMGVDRTLANVA